VARDKTVKPREVDDPALGALIIGQAQQEISSQLSVLSDPDAKLAAVTAGTLVLVPLLVNVTFPIGLGLALPLAFSAGWSTYGLFGRTFQIGPDLPGYLTGKDPTEPALRKRLQADLLASVEANSAKTDRKTKAFNGSGNIFLVSGVAAALLFAIQVIAGQKLPGPLKTAGDWWLANALGSLLSSRCCLSGSSSRPGTQYRPARS
jgi:hypothetical protein